MSFQSGHIFKFCVAVKADKVLFEHWLILGRLEFLHLIGSSVSTDNPTSPESNVFYQVGKIIGFCIEPGQHLVNMQEEPELGWKEL